MKDGVHSPQRVNRHMTRRICTYALGLFLAALSANLSVMANLGNSAVNSSCVVYGMITGLEMGTVLIIVNLLVMVAELAVLGRHFQWINLAQVPFTLMYGQFVNIVGRLMPDVILTQWYLQVPLLLVALFLLALGILLYVNTELVSMPMEGFCLAVAAKTPIKFHNMKTLLDCSFLLLGIVSSFIFLGRLAGVGIGTVVLALGTGTLMGKIKPFLPRWMQSWHLD